MESSDSDVTAMESSSPSLPNNGASSSRTLQLPLLRLLQFPVSSLLEYTGILTARSADYPYSESRPLIPDNTSAAVSVQNPRILEPVDGLAGGANSNNSAGSSTSSGEVAIRIFGERERSRDLSNAINGDVGGDGLGLGESTAGVDIAGGSVSSSGSDGDRNSNRNESAHQRYDVQQATRWIEQVLPFSLLLLMVFIRQHFIGFCVSIYITVVLYKSNEILRKQTALKGERKILILLGYSFIFMLHTLDVYWWNQEVELFYPLLMIPPKAIPPFWHAIFIILVNDTLVRQSAMILKLFLLIYYKNGRGHNFRRQGQMLTLIEYTVLLYRALLPTPVWYRFFLNKEYGSLFSSLTTGLYLTLKLMSIVDKVRSFIISFKALSRKEVQYGSYATAEQVNAAGDLCAICQEKMHSPILLRCKHIFCEECVSEWFERERTCPLCRAMVRPAELKSYGDGSTNLLFHLF